MFCVVVAAHLHAHWRMLRGACTATKSLQTDGHMEMEQTRPGGAGGRAGRDPPASRRQLETAGRGVARPALAAPPRARRN